MLRGLTVVAGHGDRQVGRQQVAAHGVELLFDRAGECDRVGALSLGDRQRDGGVGLAAARMMLDVRRRFGATVRHRGDIAEVHGRAGRAADDDVAHGIDRFERGAAIDANRLVAADDLRRQTVGDTVRYVVNRNINYTNICAYRCSFCAFSKGTHSKSLRGEPYDLPLAEIERRVSEAWSRGATEVWNVRNAEASMPHPFHIHGFQFQILERKGSPAQQKTLSVNDKGLAASDLGWKDTVLVWPGETVCIAIDFTHPFKGDQVYMIHCHNLEHEDQGMMLNLKVQA